MEARRADRGDRELLPELTSHLRFAGPFTAERRPDDRSARDCVDLALLESSLLPVLPPDPPGITYHLQRAECLLRSLPPLEATAAAELLKEALERLGS